VLSIQCYECLNVKDLTIDTVHLLDMTEDGYKCRVHGRVITLYHTAATIL
jgi:hypothetical protein